MATIDPPPVRRGGARPPAAPPGGAPGAPPEAPPAFPRRLPGESLSDTTSGRTSTEVEEQEDWVISYMDMVTLLMTVFLGMVAILGMQPKGAAAPGARAPGGAQTISGGGPGALSGAGLWPGGNGLLPAGAASGAGGDEGGGAGDGGGRAGEATGEGTGGVATATVARPGAAPARPPDGGEATDAGGGPALSPDAARLLARLQAAGLPPTVDLAVSRQRVTITLQDRILFASGSAALEPTALATLETLAATLAAVPGTITVAGHTDDVAISTARFPSNWELSSARAAAVVRTLIASGVPAERLQAVGYADTRPLDRTPENRARNRRVEILVDTAP
ncbi:OmpA family protein [Oleisolibacter albus]|uniref:OmpA family protein n=1 Tax=Oleisolibacter albus TaxID=2171757 RepID=UPI000DF39FF5|nr:OmpA family protein [Oleisolibacter albus]